MKCKHGVVGCIALFGPHPRPTPSLPIYRTYVCLYPVLDCGVHMAFCIWVGRVPAVSMYLGSLRHIVISDVNTASGRGVAYWEPHGSVLCTSPATVICYECLLGRLYKGLSLVYVRLTSVLVEIM